MDYKIKQIYSNMHHGKQLVTDDDKNQMENVIHEYLKRRQKEECYLILVGSGMQCANREEMKNYFEERQPEKGVEEILGKYTFENFTLYCAVHALVEAEKDLDEIIKILE